MIDTNQIDDFFNRYSSVVNNALFGGALDMDVITQSFADFVVGANPMGVAGGSNNEQFRKSIERGIDFYKEIGITSMNISSKEITALDDFHAMVKINWTAFYVKESASGEIAFEAFYMVQHKGGNSRIFAYVTGDEQGALREHQLIQ